MLSGCGVRGCEEKGWLGQSLPRFTGVVVVSVSFNGVAWENLSFGSRCVL